MKMPIVLLKRYLQMQEFKTDLGDEKMKYNVRDFLFGDELKSNCEIITCRRG